MRRYIGLLAAGLLALSASSAVAAVQTREVEYKAGDTPLKGLLAWDDAATGKRPGIIVVHEWWGENEHARTAARRLAEAGYVALAVDMYGNGKTTTHPDEAQKFMSEAMQNPAAIGARFNAGLEQLKADSHVDPERIGAIGFCFGGAVALAMARAGADLDAVATFHGALPSEPPVQKGAVKGRILILTGADDPMVPPQQVEKFKKEMTDAGADIQVISYPGAKHSFTNPDAGKAGMPALEYNEQAAQQSWQEMLKLFKEVFKT